MANYYIKYKFVGGLLLELYSHFINEISKSIYKVNRGTKMISKEQTKMDKEIFNKTIQNYINDSKKSMHNLMYYAKIMYVQKKVKDIIEVWL